MKLASRICTAVLGASLAVLTSSPCMGQDTTPAPAKRPAAGIDSNYGALGCAGRRTRMPHPLRRHRCLRPRLTGPLALSPPINFEAGPLGKYSMNGAVSGIGLFQNNAVPGNNPQEGAFTNAFIFFQKTTGWFQIYVQAGAYDTAFSGIGVYLQRDNATATSGARCRWLTRSWCWERPPTSWSDILPTLIGAEYTFSFQNMNVERGLLVEPGKRHQSRRPSQSDAWESTSPRRSVTTTVSTPTVITG